MASGTRRMDEDKEVVVAEEVKQPGQEMTQVRLVTGGLGLLPTIMMIMIYTLRGQLRFMSVMSYSSNSVFIT